MTEENDPKVIQGPWPKSGRKVKIPDDNSMQLQDDIEFAEELTQTVIVQMIHTMGENGIHVTEESFIRDIGFLIEVSKGTIYRSMGIPHLTHGFLEALVDVDIDENDDTIHGQIDLNMLSMLEKFIETNKDLEDDDDNDPEIS